MREEEVIIKDDIKKLVEFVSNEEVIHGCEHKDMIALGNEIAKLKAKNELLKRINSQLIMTL